MSFPDPQQKLETSYRVYSSLRAQVNYRNVTYWGAYPTLEEAKKEAKFAEDAFFESWYVTGELKWYEENLVSDEELTRNNSLQMTLH